MKGRPLSGGCREKTLQNHINVDALIQKGAYMRRDKYMGMDVHQATTVVAVIDAEGKIVLETIVATAAGPIRRFIESINGPVHVTLEETTQAEWLHDLLEGFVEEIVICDPRRNKLLVEGSRGTKRMLESWPNCCGLVWCARSGMGGKRHVA